MALNFYLKRVGITTGPLIRNTSASSLGVIKNYLCSKPQFKGGEDFLIFGNALHEQFLEGKFDSKNSLSLSDTDKLKIKVMLTKLWAHPVVKSLMANSIREDKCYSELNGVKVAFILDIKKPQILTGADLKTTNCTNMNQCVDKALAFGYFRQAIVYKKCAGLKHFYFIFVQKEEPHNIFILDVSMYPEHELYAERELEFLLYFYKNYGNIVEKTGDTTCLIKVVETNNNKRKMPKTGKESLAEIKTVADEHKVNVKNATKAATLAEKSKSKLAKLIERFPAKERELYQEKLDKFSSL